MKTPLEDQELARSRERALRRLNRWIALSKILMRSRCLSLSITTRIYVAASEIQDVIRKGENIFPRES